MKTGKHRAQADRPAGAHSNWLPCCGGCLVVHAMVVATRHRCRRGTRYKPASNAADFAAAINEYQFACSLVGQQAIRIPGRTLDRQHFPGAVPRMAAADDILDGDRCIGGGPDRDRGIDTCRRMGRYPARPRHQATCPAGRD